MPQNSDLNQKIEAIGKLLQLFKMERLVYLCVTIVSFLALLGSAVHLFCTDAENKTPIVVGMFGSSGGIAFTCGRLLKMWSDAMKILSPIAGNKE